MKENAFVSGYFIKCKTSFACFDDGFKIQAQIVRQNKEYSFTKFKKSIIGKLLTLSTSLDDVLYDYKIQSIRWVDNNNLEIYYDYRIKRFKNKGCFSIIFSSKDIDVFGQNNDFLESVCDSLSTKKLDLTKHEFVTGFDFLGRKYSLEINNTLLVPAEMTWNVSFSTFVTISSNANVFINKGIVINDSYCMFLKGLIYYENEDNNGEEQIDKAIEWFVKASNANLEMASFYLGKIYSNNDKYFDREKALYYFGKAGELANSCKPLIESLSLGNNLSKEDRFLKYIDNIIEAKVDVKTYPEIAENDLKKDFGNYWNKLSDFTKNVLVTGITIFMTFKNIDSNSNSNSNSSIKLDYSPVIISISRGLEKELRNVFFDKFKKYLIKTNANPYDFRRLRDFTYIDKSGNYQFTDNNKWFTLGKLKFMVNEYSRIDYNPNSIRNSIKKTMDSYLRDYCMNFALNKSQFSSDEEMHKKEVTEYMCDLSRNVSEISDVFRNESAHTNSTSSQDRATICINWIIKVKQLLLRFLEKLDYESLESL